MQDILTIGIGVDTKEVKSASRDLDGLEKDGNKAARSADLLGKAYANAGRLIGAGMAGAALMAVRRMISATKEQEAVVAQLNAALASTGGIAGKTADELQKTASALQRITTFGDESIMKMQSLLLTFTQIRGDKFDEASKAVLNLATRMGTDLNSAAIQVGKALNDPILGVTALARSGIQFSESQKEMIKSLVETNKLAEAQTIILKELEVQFGGSAEAARNTLGGALEGLSNAFGDLFEINSTKSSFFTRTINDLTKAIELLGGATVKTGGYLAEMFPNYEKYRKIMDAEFGKDSENESTTGAMLKRDAKIGGEVVTVFQQMADAAKKFKEDNPLNDAIAKSTTYAEKIKQINELLQYGAITEQEAARFRAQFQKERDAGLEKAKVYSTEQIEDLTAINALLMAGMEIEEARLRISEARKGANQSQINELIKQRDIQAELLSIEDDRRKRIQLAIKAHEDETKAIADAAKERARINQKASDDHLREIARENDRIQREFEKTADSIRQSLTDALMRGFEDGKTFAENFKQTLINMFKTLILRPVIEFIFAPISGAISGVISNIFGGGGGSLLGGTGSMGSIFTQGKTLLTAITDGFTGLNNSLTSAIGNLGTFLSTGTGGLGDVLGGFIGQYSTQIAGILPFASAAFSLLSGDIKGGISQGIGAAIGTAIGGPVGGFIGSALGSVVGGLFGGSGEQYKQVIQQRYGTYQNGRFSATQGQSVRAPEGSSAALDAVMQRFAQNLGGLLQGFGFSGDMDLYGKTRIRRTSGRLATTFSAAFDGGDIRVEKQFGAKGDFAKGFEKFSKYVLGEVLVKAIQASSLPANIRALFDGMTDADKVAQMINAAVTLGRANDALVERFGLTADAAAGVAKATGYMGDELTAFVSKLGMTGLSMQKASVSILQARDELTKSLNKVFGTISTESVTKWITTQETLYRELMIMGHSYSLASGTTTVTKQITELVSTLTPANMLLPQTIDAFDQLLKSIDTTTQAGKEMFANVFELRDAFMAYTSAIDGLKNGVNDAIYSMLSPAEQLAQNQADLAEMFGKLNLAVPTSIEQLIALGRSIDYGTESGLDLAMAFPILVQAFQQAEAGVVALAGTLGLLNKNNFSNVIDFNRAQAYLNNGIPLSQLPSYDVGTSYVPKDGPAMLHRGEAVLTASENRSRSSEGGVVAEIRALRAEIIDLKRASAETAKNTKRTSDTLLNVSRGGDSIFTEAA